MLTIENLSKTYAGGVRALDRVSLEVCRGLFGLLGPNGAGKSTLLRTLATLQEPDSGRVDLDGLDLLAAPHEVRRRLGYLPQDFGVYPGVSAWDLLEHLAVLKGLIHRQERREQVAALLQQTHLYERRKDAVSTFSGGMRQRFGIAQALLGDPRLMLVDEPTAGLDPEERSRFLNLLAEMGEQVVVVLSTHIVEDVRQLCPHMGVLAAGRVLVSGAPAELTARLAGRIWANTVSRDHVPRLRAAHAVLGTQLHAGRTLLRIVAPEQPEPGFEAVEPQLEDVYFAALREAQAA